MVAVQWFGREPRPGFVYITRYPGRVSTFRPTSAVSPFM